MGGIILHALQIQDGVVWVHLCLHVHVICTYIHVVECPITSRRRPLGPCQEAGVWFNVSTMDPTQRASTSSPPACLVPPFSLAQQSTLQSSSSLIRHRRPVTSPLAHSYFRISVRCFSPTESPTSISIGVKKENVSPTRSCPLDSNPRTLPRRPETEHDIKLCLHTCHESKSLCPDRFLDSKKHQLFLTKSRLGYECISISTPPRKDMAGGFAIRAGRQ